VRAGDSVITTKAAAQAAPALEIEFQDGRVAVGDPGTAAVAPPKPKPARAKPATRPKGQGSLFD